MAPNLFTLRREFVSPAPAPCERPTGAGLSGAYKAAWSVSAARQQTSPLMGAYRAKLSPLKWTNFSARLSSRGARAPAR